MLFALLFLWTGSAARFSSVVQGNATANKISGLYTWGCPKTTIGQLKFPGSSDGCFPGYRVVSEENPRFPYKPGKMDIVPSLPPGDIFDHCKTRLFAIDQRDKWIKECGKRGLSIKTFSIKLHLGGTYIKYSERVPELRSVAPAFKVSYEQTQAGTNKALQGSGYTSVAMVVLGKDVSHLIRDSSGRCIVTFEGSDDAGDWVANFKFWGKNFCGLPNKFHGGFVTEIMAVVGSSGFQNDIRKQLYHCSSVDVAGHSLGGAMATLFAACSSHKLSPGQEGYEENKLFTF